MNEVEIRPAGAVNVNVSIPDPDLTVQPGKAPNVSIDRAEGVSVVLTYTGRPGRDGAAGGTKVSRIARGPINGHRVVYSLGEECAYASCDDVDTSQAILGITIESVSDGRPVQIAAQEEVVEPSWNFPVGPIFVGLEGSLVSSPVPGAKFVRQIGVAVAPDRILVQIRPPIFAEGN